MCRLPSSFPPSKQAKDMSARAADTASQAIPAPPEMPDSMPSASRRPSKASTGSYSGRNSRKSSLSASAARESYVDLLPDAFFDLPASEDCSTQGSTESANSAVWRRATTLPGKVIKKTQHRAKVETRSLQGQRNKRKLTTSEVIFEAPPTDQDLASLPTSASPNAHNATRRISNASSLSSASSGSVEIQERYTRRIPRCGRNIIEDRSRLTILPTAGSASSQGQWSGWNFKHGGRSRQGSHDSGYASRSSSSSASGTSGRMAKSVDICREDGNIRITRSHEVRSTPLRPIFHHQHGVRSDLTVRKANKETDALLQRECGLKRGEYGGITRIRRRHRTESEMATYN